MPGLSFLESSPVVVRGSTTTTTEDVHRNTSKPPRFTNIVATLLVAENRDGALDDNRNSDASHNIKLTGQGAGFAGGFACRVEFGTEYKNEEGESVAPMVSLVADGFGSSISNVTATGYDLSTQALALNAVANVRIAVFQPT